MVDNANDESANQVENRFADASEEEVNDLLTNIHSENTAKSAKFAVKMLRDYCLAKEHHIEFEYLPVSERLWKLVYLSTGIFGKYSL